MPVELERKLRRQGRKKGFKGDRLDRFVFGTMATIEKKKAQKKVRKTTRKRK